MEAYPSHADAGVCCVDKMAHPYDGVAVCDHPSCSYVEAVASCFEEDGEVALVSYGMDDWVAVAHQYSGRDA